MPEPRKFGSMEEWRKASGKEPTVATCKICQEPLKNPNFDTCYSCSQKSRANQTATPRQAVNQLPEGYLENGYFDQEGYMREDMITTYPKKIARAFEQIGLTPGQIRRFYAHARYADRRLEYGEPFEAVRPAILAMEPLVASAVGRAKANNSTADYQLFYDFIDKNVSLASKSKKAFHEGFLLHFQYVVAYFTYLKPKG